MGLKSVSRAKPPILPRSWKAFSEPPYSRNRIPESPISFWTELRTPSSLGIQPQHFSPRFPWAPAPERPYFSVRTLLSSAAPPEWNFGTAPSHAHPATPPSRPEPAAAARGRGGPPSLGAGPRSPLAPELRDPGRRAGGGGRGRRQRLPYPLAAPSRPRPSRPASEPRPPPRGPSRAAPAARPLLARSASAAQTFLRSRLGAAAACPPARPRPMGAPPKGA